MLIIYQITYHFTCQLHIINDEFETKFCEYTKKTLTKVWNKAEFLGYKLFPHKRQFQNCYLEKS